jgi:hypothetical protein
MLQSELDGKTGAENEWTGKERCSGFIVELDSWSGESRRRERQGRLAPNEREKEENGIE